MDKRDFEHEHRAMIAVAKAGWNGSPCWHVLDWMCLKLRWKYPLIRKSDQIINWNTTTYHKARAGRVERWKRN